MTSWSQDDRATTQIKLAIERVIAMCDRQEKDGSYQLVSLRGVLIELGYGNANADKVIEYCADRGFDYCIDPIIESHGGHPAPGVCVWGPDQLKSRLECVR